MLIQILEEYRKRTEYRLLNNFCNNEAVSIKTLKKGVLVLPGILLNKMKNEEIQFLNIWLENNTNQLILLPSWCEINLSEYFNTSVDIKIKRTEDSMYNNIPVNYEIEAAVKDKLFIENSKVFGINYRIDLSSGFLTVVTLPLLDYKMIELEDELKEYFNDLIQSKSFIDEKPEENNSDIGSYIDNLHLFIIILLAANVQFQEQVSSSILKYFGIRYEEELLQKKYKELISSGFINNKKLTDKGINIIETMHLKSFIDVVEERRENENGWN